MRCSNTVFYVYPRPDFGHLKKKSSNKIALKGSRDILFLTKVYYPEVNFLKLR